MQGDSSSQNVLFKSGEQWASDTSGTGVSNVKRVKMICTMTSVFFKAALINIFRLPIDQTGIYNLKGMFFFFFFLGCWFGFLDTCCHPPFFLFIFFLQQINKPLYTNCPALSNRQKRLEIIWWTQWSCYKVQLCPEVVGGGRTRGKTESDNWTYTIRWPETRL